MLSSVWLHGGPLTVGQGGAADPSGAERASGPWKTKHDPPMPCPGTGLEISLNKQLSPMRSYLPEAASVTPELPGMSRAGKILAASVAALAAAALYNTYR